MVILIHNLTGAPSCETICSSVCGGFDGDAAAETAKLELSCRCLFRGPGPARFITEGSLLEHGMGHPILR